MIHVVTGKPGEGKTWFASSLIPKFLKEGRTVGCSFDIDLFAVGLDDAAKQMKKISGFQDVLDFHDGVLILDEAQSWFNSRTWDSLPLDLQTKWQQHRKDRVDIFIISQDLSRVDVALRQLVGRYFAVYKWWRVFFINEYEPKINAQTQDIEQTAIDWWIQVSPVPLKDPKIRFGLIEILKLGWKYPHRIYATYQKIGNPNRATGSVAERDQARQTKKGGGDR